MIRSSTGLAALAFALGLGSSGLARAQAPAADPDAGKLHPTDGAAAADPLAPADVPQPAKPTPAPAPAKADPGVKPGAVTSDDNGPDPLIGGNGVKPADGAPAAGPAANPNDPEAIPNDDPRADRLIKAHRDDAINTYQKVLDNDDETTTNLDHRIKVNEDLVTRYKKALAVSNDGKRRLQIDLFNRTFYLKQQRDRGAIPDDTFEKLMKQEQKSYNDKCGGFNSDIEFYTKEIADAEVRLNELRAERRVKVTTTRAHGVASGKKKLPKKPSEQLLTTLSAKLGAIWDPESKDIMDGSSPVCDECLNSPGAPTPTPAAPDDKAATLNTSSSSAPDAKTAPDGK